MKRVAVVAGLLISLFRLCHAQPALTRAELLAIPEVAQNPLKIKIVSQQEQDGVIVEELFINGAPFGGKPTRIYAWYARPKAPGKVPGVVQLHGSGLVKLTPDAAIDYAKHNYACISLDWAGPDWKSEGILRAEPRSDFQSTGSGAVSVPDGTGDPKHTHFQAVEPAESSITNGVRFVRRAFQFLRSRPEVAADQLCLSGMSAGAHLSLLVLGVEPDIKAAAVKYGSGFIRELNWGGYYGPISIAGPPEVVARWLAALDPQYGFSNIKAETLVLSGTDDIFFKMPAVLATWRAIPSHKALVMLPNDNHSQVGNEVVPRQWFDFVLKRAPEWPVPDAPQAAAHDDSLELNVAVRGTISRVMFWYKRMPAGIFNYERGKPPEETVPWRSVATQQAAGHWTATLPALVAGERIMAYAMADGAAGTQASSDTVELKSSQPQTAASNPSTTATPARDQSAGNYFQQPSFEDGPLQKGPVGKLYLNCNGNPLWTNDANKAHTGTGAMRVGDENQIVAGAPATAGARYRLSGWFRGESAAGTQARLQINWQRQDGSLIKFDIVTPGLTTDYQKIVLAAGAPPETAASLLIIGGSGGAVMADDVYFGLEPVD